MMDIRPTSEQALEYIWFGRQCLDLARRSGRPGAKAIQDGRLLVICKYTLHHATLITLSQGDFAMHPRSGRLAKLPYYDSDMNLLYTLTRVRGGGYAPSNDGFAQLAGGDPYPLRDNDHATFVISVDGEEVDVEEVDVEWAEAGEENYGNIWWTSSGDNPITLSWRGPPAVQFPLPSSYSIPGLTQDDGTGGSTVFGCYIYRDGARIHGPQWFSDDEMATLIIGACYAADNTGTLWLVAITVTRRDSTYWLQVWRSGDAGKNWQMLNEFAGSRARTPAFISGDGRSFVYEGAMYAVDATVSSVSLSGAMPAATAGTRTINGAGGYGSNFEYHGNGHCWPGMSPDGQLSYSSFKVNASFTELGSGNGAVGSQTTSIPVYLGNPATEVTIEAGYNSGQWEFTAKANGSYCSVNWSGVDSYAGPKAWKVPGSCSADISVTATLAPQGISASYSHEASSGVLTINGPDAVTLYAQYSATNAVGKVTWSISSGTIAENGMITAVEGCGVATITATDACGRSDSKQVRLPTGMWVFDYWMYYPAYKNWAGYEIVENSPDGSYSEYTVSGNPPNIGTVVQYMRYDDGLGCYQSNYVSSYVCDTAFPVSTLSTRTSTKPATVFTYQSCADGHPTVNIDIPKLVCPYVVTRSIHYKWVCP